MKIVQLNSTCGVGSTGKICLSIAKLANEKGIYNFIFFTQGKKKYTFSMNYSSHVFIKVNALLSKIIGNYGFNSFISTLKLLYNLEKIKPNIIHIHNIHSHDCNLNLLFKYIKKRNINVIWTFHDCWAFTGYCVHFDLIECKKWVNKCYKCPQRKKYSYFFDRSAYLYQRKKELFSNLNLRIVAPSNWLANLVNQSFLKCNPISVINNGIDLSIFKPTESNFREKYKINKLDFLILGVAFDWGYKKGLDIFIELSRSIKSNYKIILVGTDSNVDKLLPKNIISIHKTENQNDLADIYSAVDVFVNPTREDTFPTVNIEAIACGTPVITFETGGSTEIVTQKTGVIIRNKNITNLVHEIERVCESKPFKIEDLLDRAQDFEMNSKYEEYIRLYESVISI